MNLAHLVHVAGITLIALSAALALAGGVAIGYGEPDALSFMAAAGIALAIGLTAYRRTTLVRDLSIREGYAVVAISWIVVGLAGATPYLFSGVIESPVAAFFESVSGVHDHGRHRLRRGSRRSRAAFSSGEP